MNALTCPLCIRKIINLPAKSRNKIYANANAYAQERRIEEAAPLIESRPALGSPSVVPPALEVMQALRVLYEFGIPAVILPDVRITLDPECNFPPAGQVYQDVLGLIMDFIVEEYGLDLNVPDRMDGDDDTNPFEHIPVVHKIMTVPIRTPEALQLARENRGVFNVMSFRISELPPMEL
jgi:hypothetical protein